MADQPINPDDDGRRVFRVCKPEASGWTSVPNAMLRDKRLSFRARGALAWMLSHEDGYLVGTAQLHAHANEGREAIRTVLRELAAAGYLRQSRAQDEDGRWRTVTEVYAVSTGAQEPATGDGFPGPGFPGAGFLGPKENEEVEEEEKNTPSSSPRTTRASGAETVPSPAVPVGVAIAAAPPTDVDAQVKAVEAAVCSELWGASRAVVAQALMDDRAGVAALVEHAVATAKAPAGYVVSACRRGQHVGFAAPAAARPKRPGDAGAERFVARALAAKERGAQR